MIKKIVEISSCYSCPHEGLSGVCTKDHSIMCMIEIPIRCQLPIFDAQPLRIRRSRPRNVDLIRSVSGSQHEILAWIQKLYGIPRFDLDLTYSKGRFYRNGIRAPRFKMDIRPLQRDVIPASATAIPFKNCSLESIVFDPPFLHMAEWTGP